MKGILRYFGNSVIIPVSIVAEVVHMFFIPAKYAFTYVQAVLMISSSFAELYRGDKEELSYQYNL